MARYKVLSCCIILFPYLDPISRIIIGLFTVSKPESY